MAGSAPAYAGVVIDLDGVCYRGDAAIDGSRAAVTALRDAGIGVMFATNNATRTPEQSADKLAHLGFDVAPDDIMTSAVAAAALLEPGDRCMVIGMHGLRAAVTDRGCELADDPAQTDVVLTGLDRDLTYDKLVRGTRALLAGARFVASNADRSFPDADGISPGAGVIMVALETATGRAAQVAGKPEPTLFETAASRLPDGRLLMIGDRVETDIAGAAALGWDTGLVLTGITGADQARDADPAPTYVADDLAALVRDLLDSHA
ncbi:MAG: HAD-IIA family hydrolase [Actinobacteria bacterium]|nr:HAD-IIA family hydrolase [Actinomycetota bacterium]